MKAAIASVMVSFDIVTDVICGVLICQAFKRKCRITSFQISHRCLVFMIFYIVAAIIVANNVQGFTAYGRLLPNDSDRIYVR